LPLTQLLRMQREDPDNQRQEEDEKADARFALPQQDVAADDDSGEYASGDTRPARPDRRLSGIACRYGGVGHKSPLRCRPGLGAGRRATRANRPVCPPTRRPSGYSRAAGWDGRAKAESDCAWQEHATRSCSYCAELPEVSRSQRASSWSKRTAASNSARRLARRVVI